jgi:hypothetical protein
MAINDWSLKSAPQPQQEKPPTIQEIQTLREELRENYLATKNFLALVTAQEHADPKEVATVINTLSTILRDLIKLDDAVYNQERVQIIEQVMIETMQDMPDEVKTRFFELYSQRIEHANKPS